MNNQTPTNLFYLYNNLGFTDLELSGTFKDQQGELCFTKWERFDHLMEKQNVDWKKYTERRIADVEIVLDYDEYICKKCLNLTSKETCHHCGHIYTKSEQRRRIFEFANLKIKQLKRDHYKFKAFATGNKGVHIHLIFPQLRTYSRRERETFKEQFITKYCAEKQKKIDRVMIMQEGALHRKSGLPKNLIDERTGYNYILENI